MTKSKVLILLLISAALLYVLLRDKEVAAVNPTINLKKSKVTSQSFSQTYNIKPKSDTDTKNQGSNQQIILGILPNKQKVLDEIQSHSHTTPPSILKFAQELEDLYQSHAHSLEQAKLLMTELSHCVQTKKEQAVDAIRVQCLLVARDLSKDYFELQPTYEDLLQNTSQRVQDITNSIPQ